MGDSRPPPACVPLTSPRLTHTCTAALGRDWTASPLETWQDQAHSEWEDHCSGTCGTFLPLSRARHRRQCQGAPAASPSITSGAGAHPQQLPALSRRCWRGAARPAPDTAFLTGTPKQRRPGVHSVGRDSQQHLVPSSHQRVWDRQAHKAQAWLQSLGTGMGRRGPKSSGASA